MAQKFYQKATVQGAIVTGVFAVIIAVITISGDDHEINEPDPGVTTAGLLPGQYHCQSGDTPLKQCQVTPDGQGGLLLSFATAEHATRGVSDTFRGSVRPEDECVSVVLTNYFSVDGRPSEQMPGGIVRICLGSGEDARWSGTWGAANGATKTFTLREQAVR